MNSDNSFFNFITFVVWILLILLFAGAGIYFGIWTMLVGGIVQIVNACQITPVVGTEIAWGVVKIIFFEIPIFIGLGIAMCIAINPPE